MDDSAVSDTEPENETPEYSATVTGRGERRGPGNIVHVQGIHNSQDSCGLNHSEYFDIVEKARTKLENRCLTLGFTKYACMRPTIGLVLRSQRPVETGCDVHFEGVIVPLDGKYAEVGKNLAEGETLFEGTSLVTTYLGARKVATVSEVFAKGEALMQCLGAHFADCRVVATLNSGDKQQAAVVQVVGRGPQVPEDKVLRFSKVEVSTRTRCKDDQAIELIEEHFQSACLRANRRGFSCDGPRAFIVTNFRASSNHCKVTFDGILVGVSPSQGNSSKR